MIRSFPDFFIIQTGKRVKISNLELGGKCTITSIISYNKNPLMSGNNVNVNIKMYKSDKIKMYNYSKLT